MRAVLAGLALVVLAAVLLWNRGLRSALPSSPPEGQPVRSTRRTCLESGSAREHQAISDLTAWSQFLHDQEETWKGLRPELELPGDRSSAWREFSRQQVRHLPPEILEQLCKGFLDRQWINVTETKLQSYLDACWFLYGRQMGESALELIASTNDDPIAAGVWPGFPSSWTWAKSEPLLGMLKGIASNDPTLAWDLCQRLAMHHDGGGTEIRPSILPSREWAKAVVEEWAANFPQQSELILSTASGSDYFGEALIGLAAGLPDGQPWEKILVIANEASGHSHRSKTNAACGALLLRWTYDDPKSALEWIRDRPFEKDPSDPYSSASETGVRSPDEQLLRLALEIDLTLDSSHVRSRTDRTLQAVEAVVEHSKSMRFYSYVRQHILWNPRPAQTFLYRLIPRVEDPVQREIELLRFADEIPRRRYSSADPFQVVLPVDQPNPFLIALQEITDSMKLSPATRTQLEQHFQQLAEDEARIRKNPE